MCHQAEVSGRPDANESEVQILHSAETPALGLEELLIELARVRDGDLRLLVPYPKADAHVQQLAELINLVLCVAHEAVEGSRQAHSRLAASVSHELNNPLGAVKSATDTLLKIASGTDSGEPLLDAAAHRTSFSELCQSVQQATERMQQTIGRIQRFANLEGAAVHSIDLNELVSDVVALAKPQFGASIQVQLDLGPLPSITCRPAQLSSAFAALLHETVAAADGSLLLRTRLRSGRVEVQIQDEGSHLLAGRPVSILENGLHGVGAIRSARDWNLLSARRVVHEHAGEIRTARVSGRGTALTVVLPLELPPEERRGLASSGDRSPSD